MPKKTTFNFGANKTPKAPKTPKPPKTPRKPRRTGGSKPASNAWRAYVGDSGGWDSIPD